jgi:hypothetical protein
VWLRQRNGFLFLALATLAASALHGQTTHASTTAAIAAARTPGVVLACRHAKTNRSDNENETTLSYDDPSAQRGLTAEGERQASATGKTLWLAEGGCVSVRPPGNTFSVVMVMLWARRTS